MLEARNPFAVTLAMMGRRRYLASSAIVSALFVAGAAGAQPLPGGSPTGQRPSEPAAGPVVSEVYVTARKREERLVDVPAAISALSSKEIQRYGISDTKNLTQDVPNLVILPGGTGAGGSVGIRGVMSAAAGADVGVSPEVAYNIDGVNITRGRISTLGLLDTANVQVLEGPQALYFGKNSPAGVVSLASVDPGRAFTGFIEESYEFTTVAPQVDGAVTIPINDALSVRLAFEAQEQRGYIRNDALPVVNLWGNPPSGGPFIDPGAANKYQDGSDQELGRITVKYTPNDRFTAVLKDVGSRYRGNSEDSTDEQMCAPGVSQVFVSPGFGFPAAPDPADSHCSSNGLHAIEGGLNASLAARWPGSNGGVPFTLTTMDVASLSMSYKFDDVTLTSVTGYFNLNHHEFINASDSSYMFYAGVEYDTYNQYSEELRAQTTFKGPVNFMGGGYIESSKDTFTTDNFFSPLGTDTVTGRLDTTTMVDNTTDNTYSLFGSVDWKILSNLDLNAGARWTEEPKLSKLEDTYLNDRPLLLFGIYIQSRPGFVYSLPSFGTNVSPEVTLAWHPEPNLNLYAAFKTGYKSGGISNAETLANFANDAAAAANLSFKPETSIGGEVGAKGEWMDGRLQATFDVYDYDFRNLQVESLSFTPGQAPIFHIVNAAAAQTTGAEFQGSYQIFDDLMVRGHLDYNNAVYTSFDNAACSTDQLDGFAPGCVTDSEGAQSQNLSNKSLPLAPKWLVGGGATYTHAISDSLRMSLDGDLNYSGSFVRSYGIAYFSQQPGYFLLNAAVRLSRPGNGWEVALIGTNLTNTVVIYGLGNVPGAQAGVYGGDVAPPREVTLRLSYQF